MRKKKKNKQIGLPSYMFQKTFWASIGKTCIITWLILIFWCGLSIVEYQASINCYINENSLLSIQRKEPLSVQINLLGNIYRLDFEFMNQAAKISHRYFSVIPAPLRLGKQLYLSVQERYQEQQTQKRLQEFMKNI